MIDVPTRGRAWSDNAARVELRHSRSWRESGAASCPNQLRHAHPVAPMREGIALPLIQRQLGHSHLSTTGTYLEGINTEEIISTIHARRAPLMPASAGRAL
jgi:site-specific recombinase XerD